MKIEKNRLYQNNFTNITARVLDVSKLRQKVVFVVPGSMDPYRVNTFAEFISEWSPKYDRPTSPEYLMHLAEEASVSGTCDRRRVGAVAARDRRVITTGFNGAPEGCTHCDHSKYENEAEDPNMRMVGDHLSCVRAVHAEANVLAYAARYGVSLEGATLYTNTYPCLNCTRALISAKIKEVVYDSDYFNDSFVEGIAKESGLVLTRFQGTYYRGG